MLAPLYVAPADADPLLEVLDPEQRVVAVTLTGPVCVLAGAGTGKTRAITSRLAYGVLSGQLQPQQTLALTFTSRAAGEMRARLRQLGVPNVAARTFHSAALRQLKYFWPRCIGGPTPDLVSSKAALVATAASRLRFPTDRTSVRDLAAEIEWTKVTLTSPEAYAEVATAARRTPPAGLDVASMARLLPVYEEVKRDRGVLDFEDVLVLMIGLLADREDVAATVRSQYSTFVVDEYQDVSPLQQQLLDLWLGGRDSLCVVGDAQQTIYSFAGATPRALLDFRTRYPDATVVNLVRNYRSTPPVVSLANALVARAPESAGPRLSLVSQREEPAGGGSWPAPRFEEYADEPGEAAGVVRRIGELMRSGVRASAIAILYRINAQSEAYEQALADAGIPYVLRGGERFFERPEVREALVLLRGAARAGDGDYAEDLEREVRAVLNRAGLSAEAPAGGSARERWESLSAIASLAGDLAATRPGIGLSGLLAELDERVAASHAPVVEGITLASLHAAKGLEWDAVFLVGLTDGMLPITYAETPAQVEEERRLLYVGITRAREHLELSWALARTPGGRGSRKPSRFLDGLRPQSAATPTSRRVASGKGSRASATCRTCGRSLSSAVERKLGRCEGCPSTYDEALLSRLKEWRLERSRADSVPAYVVFTDATLVAIAEAQPTSLGELSRIGGVGATKLERYGADVIGFCNSA